MMHDPKGLDWYRTSRLPLLLVRFFAELCGQSIVELRMNLLCLDPGKWNRPIKKNVRFEIGGLSPSIPATWYCVMNCVNPTRIVVRK
jgi:hypothetical protein